MCLLRASSGEAFAESIPCSWARRLRPPTCCPLLSLDLCTRWQALSILSCSTSPTSASSLLPEVPVQLPLTDSCPLSAWTWFPDSHGWSECLPSLFPKPPFHGDLDTQCKGGGAWNWDVFTVAIPRTKPNCRPGTLGTDWAWLQRSMPVSDTSHFSLSYNWNCSWVSMAWMSDTALFYRYFILNIMGFQWNNNGNNL